MKLKFLLLAVGTFVLSITLVAQNNINVKGTVVSNEDNKVAGVKKGEPLIGVTVSVKGTTKGTVTDFDGNFEIKDIPADATLVFSYIGFATQEVKVSPSQTNYNISMKTESILIEEVVAVGYGRQKQADVTGAVARVKESEMKQTINSDLSQAMQGRMAGVTVTQSSGSPGAASVVNIRGIGSINGTQPLYVVDGVPVEYQSVTNLNPNDIETMDVLKDASSAAIYGARGANGVVIITTKKGKEGKPRVEFETTSGLQEAWRVLEPLNASQYLSYMNDMYNPKFNRDGVVRDTGYTPDKVPAFYKGGPSEVTVNGQVFDPRPLRSQTNWPNHVFTVGKIESHNVGVRGANSYASYAFSVGYFKNEGIIRNTSFERYSIRSNTEFTPKKWLKVGQNGAFSYMINKNGNADILSPYLLSPLMPVFDPQNGGGWAAYNREVYGANNARNPVAWNYQTQGRTQTMYFLGNAFTEVDFGNLLGIKAIEGFKFKTSIGVELSASRNTSISNTFEGFRGTVDDRVIAVRSVGDGRNNNYSWVADNTLTYSRVFGKHDLVALGGVSAQYYYFSSVGTGLTNVPGGINTIIDGGNTTDITLGGGDDQYALLGYIGRLQYKYDDKYLFTANIRYDGSSRFGQDSRFGLFPSFNAGWRISSENFMKSVQWVSDLKLRAGYGQTGNQQFGLNQTGGNFIYEQTIIPNILRYPFGPGNSLGNNTIYTANAPTTGLANKTLRWETVEMVNVGVDLGLFQNKFQFNLDFFEKVSKGMLIPVPIPSQSGVTGYGDNVALARGGSVYYANAGSVRNRGFEFAFTYRNEKGKFKYSISPNFTYVQNEVLKLEGNFGSAGAKISDAGGNTITEPGQPIGYMYGYVVDGIIQDTATLNRYKDAISKDSTKRSVGDIKFKDVNNDGRITEKDRTRIGQPFPIVSYGLTFEARYKGFDFRIFFQGVYGNNIYNGIRNNLEAMDTQSSPPDANQLSSVVNRWTPNNRNTDMPRAVANDPNNNNRFSSRWIEDGSFLRLKSLSLGYTVPEGITKRMFKTSDPVSLRFFVQMQNLLTFTNYKGFDPEIGSFSPTFAGFDGGNYPQPRTYSVGARLEF